MADKERPDYYDLAYVKEAIVNGEPATFWITIGKANVADNGRLDLRFDSLPWNWSPNTRLALFPKFKRKNKDEEE